MQAAQQAATSLRKRRLGKAVALTSSARGVARWVAALEAFLSAVETAVWELRACYEGLGKAILDSWGGAKGRVAELQEERRNRQAELERLLAISAVVTKTVLAYRWLAIRQAFMSEAAGGRAMARLNARTGRALFKLADRLQGGIIKVAQILSARSDILPKGITEPLSQLHDRCTPLRQGVVEGILRTAWGERTEQVVLDWAPLGSGSIGQVHRATLPDGRDVAVKVVRPGIETILRHDLANLRRVIGALAAYMPDVDVNPVLDEIEEQLLREVDLREERRALERFGSLTQGMKFVKVPQVIAEWSADEALVSELLPGKRIDQALAERDQTRVGDVLYTLADAYALQLLKWGYFQPDTHPGNFLVDDDDRVVMLDFGCVRELPAPFRRAMLAVVGGFLKGDETAVAAGLGAMGFATRSGSFDVVIQTAKAVLGDVLSTASGWDAEALVESGLRAFEDMLTDPVTAVPKEFVMVGRALANLGGLFYVHRPNFNLAEIMLPLLAEALAEEASALV